MCHHPSVLWVSPHPSLPPPRAHTGVPASYADHLLIIGDAAGHIDPLTGEGIHTAMMGGKVAAETLLEMRAAGDFSSRSTRLYQQRWMDLFGHDFKLVGFVCVLGGAMPAPGWVRLEELGVELDSCGHDWSWISSSHLGAQHRGSRRSPPVLMVQSTEPYGPGSQPLQMVTPLSGVLTQLPVSILAPPCLDSCASLSDTRRNHPSHYTSPPCLPTPAVPEGRGAAVEVPHHHGRVRL